MLADKKNERKRKRKRKKEKENERKIIPAVTVAESAKILLRKSPNPLLRF